MDLIGAIRVFTAIVETRNLSEAGRQLGLTPSTVSKQISALEEHVGALLVNRTTRRVSVTDKGKLYYERCVRILEELTDAQTELSELDNEPRGHLHLIGPTVLTERHIARLLPEFMAQHPGITVEVTTTVDLFDLVDAGVDLAIRVASQPPPEQAAIRLVDNRRVFCATPAYLARHGTPAKPAQLLDHVCAGYGGERAHSWPIRFGDDVKEMPVPCRLTSTNGEVVRQAILEDFGIAMLPTYLVHDDLATGRLVTLLSAHEAVTTGIYLVTPHKRFVERKTQRFIDYLKAKLSPVPPWEGAMGGALSA